MARQYLVQTCLKVVVLILDHHGLLELIQIVLVGCSLSDFGQRRTTHSLPLMEGYLGHGLGGLQLRVWSFGGKWLHVVQQGTLPGVRELRLLKRLVVGRDFSGFPPQGIHHGVGVDLQVGEVIGVRDVKFWLRQS